VSRDFSDVSNVDDNNALLVSSIQSLIMAYLHIFTNRTFFFADMSSVSLLFSSIKFTASEKKPMYT